MLHQGGREYGELRGEVGLERPACRLQFWQWSEFADVPVPDLAILTSLGRFGSCALVLWKKSLLTHCVSRP